MIAVTREGWILTSLVILGFAGVVVAATAWLLLWRERRGRRQEGAEEAAP